MSVYLPNPASFIFQKLFSGDRKPAKKAQDIFYIHDTLKLFGPSLHELRVIWVDAQRPVRRPRTARTVITVAERTTIPESVLTFGWNGRSR